MEPTDAVAKKQKSPLAAQAFSRFVPNEKGWIFIHQNVGLVEKGVLVGTKKCAMCMLCENEALSPSSR